MIQARSADIATPRPVLTHEDPLRPTRLYGVAKSFGENVGRYCSESSGMSVICIRFGRVTADNRPKNAREASVYLSHRDAAQIVERCIDAPAHIKFDIVYGVSDNSMRFRDVEHARSNVNYVPKDGAPGWPLPDGWEPENSS